MQGTKFEHEKYMLLSGREHEFASRNHYKLIVNNLKEGDQNESLQK